MLKIAKPHSPRAINGIWVVGYGNNLKLKIYGLKRHNKGRN